MGKDDQTKQAEMAVALYSKGRKLWTKGARDEALDMFRKAAAIQESVLGTYHKNTARTYYWVGFALKHKQEFDKALVAYRRTLRIRIALFGEEDISTEDVNRATRDILKQLDYSDDAMDQYLQEVSDSVSHEKNAKMLYEQGDYPSSVKEYNKCLAIEEEVAGLFPLDSSTLKSRIGDAYLKLGEFEKAILSYRDSLIDFETKLGRDHPDTKKCLAGIEVACLGRGLDGQIADEYLRTVFDSIALVRKGDAYADSQELEKSLEAYEGAIRVEEASLGESPLTVAGIYLKVARISSQAEMFDRSIWAIRCTLSILVLEYDKTNQTIRESLDELRVVLNLRGLETTKIESYVDSVLRSIKYEKNGEDLDSKGTHSSALEEFEKSLEIEENCLGKYHLTQAALFFSIGQSNKKLSRFDHVLMNYRRALYIQIPNLGLEHPTTARVTRQIAGATGDMGMEETVSSKYRDGVIKSVHNELQGDALLAKEKPEGAVLKYRKAVAIEEGALGHYHLCTLDLYEKITKALKMHGSKDRTLATHREVAVIAHQKLGATHPRAEQAMTELGILAKDKGLSNKEANKYCGKAILSIGIEEDGDESMKSGSYKEALTKYERAIEIEESSLGGSYLTTAILRCKQGHAHRFSGNFVDALLKYRKSIQIQVSYGNQDAARTAFFSLGLAIEGYGYNNSKSSQYLQIVQDSIEHELSGDGATDKDIHDSAIGDYLRAVSLEESALGNLFITTRNLYQKLARVCEAQEDYESAILFYGKVLSIDESYKGQDDETTLRSYNDLLLAAQKQATATRAGLQGWATLEYILMCLIGLLVTIMTMVKSMAKKESPTKKLNFTSYKKSPESATGGQEVRGRIEPVITETGIESHTVSHGGTESSENIDEEGGASAANVGAYHNSDDMSEESYVEEEIIGDDTTNAAESNKDSDSMDGSEEEEEKSVELENATEYPPIVGPASNFTFKFGETQPEGKSEEDGTEKSQQPDDTPSKGEAEELSSKATGGREKEPEAEADSAPKVEAKSLNLEAKTSDQAPLVLTEEPKGVPVVHKEVPVIKEESVDSETKSQEQLAEADSAHTTTEPPQSTRQASIGESKPTIQDHGPGEEAREEEGKPKKVRKKLSVLASRYLELAQGGHAPSTSES